MYSALKLLLLIVFFCPFAIESSSYIYVESEKFFDFKVKLAINHDDKKKGLMHLKRFNDYEGMLFIYRIPQKVNIWMHNTHIPLDIIFIDEYNKVYLIKKGYPNSDKLISSEIKVIAVLEIPRGCSNKIGISKGNKLGWYRQKKNKNKEYYHCIDS